MPASLILVVAGDGSFPDAPLAMGFFFTAAAANFSMSLLEATSLGSASSGAISISALLVSNIGVDEALLTTPGFGCLLSSSIAAAAAVESLGKRILLLSACMSASFNFEKLDLRLSFSKVTRAASDNGERGCWPGIHGVPTNCVFVAAKMWPFSKATCRCLDAQSGLLHRHRVGAMLFQSVNGSSSTSMEPGVDAKLTHLGS